MNLAKKFFRLIVRFRDRIRKDPDKPLAQPIPGPITWVMYRYFKEYRRKQHSRWLENEAKKARANYPKQIARIKRKVSKGERIKVLFLVDELAKWKAASLYSAMREDARFEPVIGLAFPHFTIGFAPRETQKRIDETEKWFLERGYKTIRLYDALKDKLQPLERLKPDIVFYPEVWYSVSLHVPSRISRFALTCYIPYFVPNYVVVSLDCQQEMHRLYWRHFVLNDELAEVYRRATADRIMAGQFVGLGHTMFDGLRDSCMNNGNCGKKIVIYAPHWTIDHPNNPSQLKYSTFTVTGRPILEYARSHTEFEWVFKPHPTLYVTLVKTGFMSKDEADGYYSSWEKIGIVCKEGDYMDLFQKSFAMITDCGSFLSEYGATGKPLIHLISSRNDIVPPKPIKALYDTYYKVHDLNEMKTVFADVLEQGNDRNREIRLAAAENLNLVGNNAATNIKDYILGELGEQ